MLNRIKHNAFVLLPYIMVVCVVAGLGALIITKKADSPIEQLAEEVIRYETGAIVDFSPNEYEKILAE